MDSRAGRTEKACGTCGKVKLLGEFHRTPNTKSADGRRSMCKACMSLYARRWRYGIDYDVLMEEQQGRCGICGTPGRNLMVDHDHATGFVRGLLCGACNTAIGLLREDPAIFAAALRWLDNGVTGG